MCSKQQGSQCGTFIWADEIDNGGGAGGSSGWGGGSGGGGRGQGGGRGKYLNLLYPSLSYRGIHFLKMIFLNLGEGKIKIWTSLSNVHPV